MPRRAIEYWSVRGVDVPVHIYMERRKNNRIAINRDKVIIRMPQIRARVMYATYIEWAKKWLEDQISDQPELLDRFRTNHYASGQIIQNPYGRYTLQLTYESRSTNAASLLSGNVIHCKLNDSLTISAQSEVIQKLVAKALAKDALPRVTDRIHQLNEQHLQQSIKAVKIKNTKTVWGSCSNNGNINISVRTLFAPLDVQDYVFIHELSHLVELNHSERYWRIVGYIMPDYREKEKWLSIHGATDFFKPHKNQEGPISE